MEQEFKIVAMLPSLNRYMRSRKTRMDQSYYLLIRSSLRRERIQRPTEFPIKIEVTGYFKDRRSQYDVTNMAGPWKVIEDALTKEGILPDDTPQYVTAVTLSSQLSESKVPYIRVRLFN